EGGEGGANQATYEHEQASVEVSFDDDATVSEAEVEAVTEEEPAAGVESEAGIADEDSELRDDGEPVDEPEHDEPEPRMPAVGPIDAAGGESSSRMRLIAV